MDPLVLLSFLGAAVLLTIAPGPDLLFVIAQSISQDKKAGIAVACGLCTGLLVHTSAAAIGVSALIYSSAIAFTIVKYAGAAYLIYLAIQAFRDRSTLQISSKQRSAYSALYRRGIFMSVLNPKVSLFFLALLPQFVVPTAGHEAWQMIVLGLIFIVQALIIFTIVSIFSHKVRTWLARSPLIARRFNIVQGLLFTIIALQMALARKS